MAVLALTSASIYVAGYDITGDANKVSLSVESDELDVTTFGSGGARQLIGGLRDVEMAVEGFSQSGSGQVAEQLFPDLGVADRVVTVCPTGAAASAAYLCQVGKFKVEEYGEIGAVLPFTLSAMGTSPQGLVKGQLAAAKQSKSATGALGSVVQLGAVPTGQYLYAALHVFSAGTTMTVQVQSDDNSGMTSPTTVATFPAATAAGGLWLTRVAGPIADAHYRLNISAITGTFQVAGTIGIGT